jgi:hypothetical protein
VTQSVAEASGDYRASRALAYMAILGRRQRSPRLI